MIYNYCFVQICAEYNYNFTVHEINNKSITDVYKNQYVSGILNPT